jgi:PEP-CTERM motif
MNALSRILAIFAFSATAISSQAAVVTSLPGGSALVIPAAMQIFTSPVTVAPGVTLTSTERSVYGWTGTYGFGSNGVWKSHSSPMIGLDSGTGHFDLFFAGGISGFVAELNWSTGEGGDASIQIFDSSNNLLESLTLESGGLNVVAPGFYGFSRATADIASVRFNEEYIGIRNITILASATNVPEPGSLVLLGIGLAGFAVSRRKSAKQ